MGSMTKSHQEKMVGYDYMKEEKDLFKEKNTTTIQTKCHIHNSEKNGFCAVETPASHIWPVSKF